MQKMKQKMKQKIHCNENYILYIKILLFYISKLLLLHQIYHLNKKIEFFARKEKDDEFK